MDASEREIIRLASQRLSVLRAEKASLLKKIAGLREGSKSAASHLHNWEGQIAREQQELAAVQDEIDQLEPDERRALEVAERRLAKVTAIVGWVVGAATIISTLIALAALLKGQ